jgi:heterodisulfide reductase subunit C
MSGSIFFVILTFLMGRQAYKGYQTIRQAILLGKPDAWESDQPLKRWRNTLLVAFGQKKMFKNLIPAVLHFFIYVAFLFTQIELVEIITDGLFGTHRFFAPYLGVLYPVIISTIEILSVLAFFATIAFLWRRNVAKVKRFDKPELKGWPALDANIILGLEIVLIFGIFTMNGADKALQFKGHPDFHDTGFFAITSWLGPAVFKSWPVPFLLFIERFGWWLHYFVVLCFLVYLAYSKHLHILLAFPTTWYAKLTQKGHADNMPEVMHEVKSMLGLAEATNSDQMPTFGAADVTQMSQRLLMSAFACTECGRCTAECPANQTGKKLSPRKIMMDIRDRATEVSQKIATGDNVYINPEIGGSTLTAANFSDGKTLFDYISTEELHACTTCNACVEACPVMINPLDPILEMRRYEILMQSAGPSDWVPMFTALENTGAVWQMPVGRADWMNQEV